jgi:hypothetical protein
MLSSPSTHNLLEDKRAVSAVIPRCNSVFEDGSHDDQQRSNCQAVCCDPASRSGLLSLSSALTTPAVEFMGRIFQMHQGASLLLWQMLPLVAYCVLRDKALAV